ncbi:MAG: helix-turn-helix domain-containing protein, partial [Oscillospiraceae bacterium]|nr:helix-turn-helix domain-containing protein [Oscillospiraceae bacterium]
MQNEHIRRNLADIPAYIQYPPHMESAGKICDIHYHDEIELILLMDGQLRCHIDGSSVEVGVGETLFIDSLIPHWTETSTPECSYILLQFNPNDFIFGKSQGRGAARYLRNISHSKQQTVRVIPHEEIADTLKDIWVEYTAKQEGADKMILAYLYFLIGWLERNGYLTEESEVDEQAAQKLTPVFEYIDRHYGKQELSLETVSDLMGLNSAYFCRTFKRATGHGFTEYLNHVRIAKAEDMLRNTNLSILDISLEVGY